MFNEMWFLTNEQKEEMAKEMEIFNNDLDKAVEEAKREFMEKDEAFDNWEEM